MVSPTLSILPHTPSIVPLKRPYSFLVPEQQSLIPKFGVHMIYIYMYWRALPCTRTRQTIVHLNFSDNLSVLIVYNMLLCTSVSNGPWWEIHMLYTRANRCHGYLCTRNQFAPTILSVPIVNISIHDDTSSTPVRSESNPLSSQP